MVVSIDKIYHLHCAAMYRQVLVSHGRVLDGSIWNKKIRASEGLVRLDGNMHPPKLFVDELKRFILNLVTSEE